MIYNFGERLWHQWLGRPYRLDKVIDQGSGQPTVLLHGIGRSAQVWRYVVKYLQASGHRAIAFDLLGFGASPKPNWPRYNSDVHAKAVIASIEALRLGQPVILVGHSLGALIAARVARLRPDLVRHLVLYEMPLYKGLPESRRYRWRLELYARLFQKIIDFRPTFDARNQKLLDRMGRRIIGFEVTEQTWLPFIRSLEHAIVQQTAPEDIKLLIMPTDVIYGSLDMLVVRGEPKQFFGTDNEQVLAHTIRARHAISDNASRFIVSRIRAAEQPGFAEAVKKRRTIRRGFSRLRARPEPSS